MTAPGQPEGSQRRGDSPRTRDPRSEKQRKKDVVGVVRQLEGFRDRRKYRKPILDAVTKRRTGDSRRMQFDVTEDKGESLVVHGEILVRTECAPQVREALQDCRASARR